MSELEEYIMINSIVFEQYSNTIECKVLSLSNDNHAKLPFKQLDYKSFI